MTEALGTIPLGTLGFADPVTPAPPASLGGTGLLDDCYTLEAEVFSGDGATAPAWVAETSGTFALGTSPTPFAEGTLVDLAFSDRGYTTAPTDDPANVHFEARLRVPLDIERAIPLTPEAGARTTLQIGSIEIDNADGTQDATADLAVDARPVTIKSGLRTAAFPSFVRRFAGLGVAWERGTDSLRLTLRARDYLLDVPLQPSFYAGTGGAEGGADLKGKPRPQTYGICRDVAAIALNTGALIYQLHDRAVFAIDAVYDRAQALTFAADRADYAALAAATIAPGAYDTCLALGLFRLGGAPAGIVTADLRGDAPAASGGYTANAARIARRLMRDRGGLAESDLDAAGIDATEFAVPGACGFHFADPITVADALGAVCAGAYLWWGPLRSGAFTIRRWRAPGSPRYAIDANDLVAPLELLALPASADPCNWRRRVNYRRCWTPQIGTEIDNAILPAARRDFVREAYRTATVADAARRTRNRLATDPAPIDTAFDAEGDATTLAQNLLDLWAPGRRLYRAPIRTGTHDIDLDDTVRLTHPRFGLAAGKDLRVYGMDERHADRRVDLLLFG